MVYAEILAGGQGTRMGHTDMPKQFLMLGNKPILIHTVEQFMLVNEIEKIIICCPREWILHTKDIIKKHITNYSKIDVIEGGSTRNESIINGVNLSKKNMA